MSLGLAKEFIPRSMAESQGQVQSYLASCHFSLQQYPEALEAGKEAYRIRPGRSLVCICVFGVTVPLKGKLTVPQSSILETRFSILDS